MRHKKFKYLFWMSYTFKVYPHRPNVRANKSENFVWCLLFLVAQFQEWGNLSSHFGVCMIFFKCFFRRTLVTYTPVLGFWWCLLWVSKPKWAALFALDGGIYVTHFLRFTSGVTPDDLLANSMWTYIWTGIGRTWKWDLSCVQLPHSVRPCRRSTDWVMPAQLRRLYTCFFVLFLFRSMCVGPKVERVGRRWCSCSVCASNPPGYILWAPNYGAPPAPH